MTDHGGPGPGDAVRGQTAGPPEPVKKKRRIWPLVAVIGVAAIAPAYVRAYRVAGPSDAPSFLVGDRVFVIQAAYDVRVPYTDLVLLSHSDPRPGDVVMFRSPGDGAPVFKRVIGCPGETIVMRDNRLEIDGVALEYARIEESDFRTVAEDNRLGAVVETETGLGPPHWVTHTPGACPDRSFGPVHVAQGHYFVMGDNRDNSLDSRMYGSVPRASIVGKVIGAHRAVARD